jgi:integrase
MYISTPYSRVVALDPTTVAALRQHRKRQTEERLLAGPHYADSGLAFTMPGGTPIHPNRFSLWFRRHVRAAGLPAIRLHDMRHSYATAGLAAGVPPKVMSERLGHATVAFTLDTYTSALPAMDKSAARCGRRAHSWHRGSPGSKTREMTMALSC